MDDEWKMLDKELTGKAIEYELSDFKIQRLPAKSKIRKVRSSMFNNQTDKSHLYQIKTTQVMADALS